MVHYRLIHWILMMGILGAFLTGCSKPPLSPELPLSPDLMDKSPFTGIPCAAPCWHDLVIGESSESEVMSTLGTLTFINQNMVSIHRMSMPGLDASTYAPGAEITVKCIRPDKQCLTLDIADGILTEITVIVNYEIKLDEAIRYLGNPDYIGYRELGVEQISCEVFLVWSNKQLVLASEKFEDYNAVKNNCRAVGDNGKTVSSLKISEARYLSVAGLEYMLSNYPKWVFKFSGTMPEK